MRNHTKVYLRYFGYTVADTILCEYCGAVAVDIHHIVPRGMGGSKHKDTIENLVALCRGCHNSAEVDDNVNRRIKEKHLCRLRDSGTSEK